MVSVMNHGATLGDALAQRARRASSRRLSLDVGAGLLIVTLATAWRPSGWTVLASAALCFATFGAWGLSNRLLDSPGGVSNSGITASLLILRTVAIAVGIAASLFLLFAVLGVAMGTWIS